jgi:hypothetical protein
MSVQSQSKQRPTAFGKTLPGAPTPEARRHSLRCRTLPPPTEAEVARMIEDFIRQGGAVTRVSAAYALPTLAALPPATAPTPAKQS